MAVPMSRAPSHPETLLQIQKVYSEWCMKAAAIILASRFPPDQGCQSVPLRKGSFSESLASESFNFKAPGGFNLKSYQLARPDFFQPSGSRTILIEVCAGKCVSGEEAESVDVSNVQERWAFSLSPVTVESGNPERHNQTMVRKLCVTLRTLMCFTRTLPADAACRNGSLSERYWRCRVEQELPVEPLDSKWTTQEFAGVCSALGTLRLSVSYRQDLRWKWSSGGDHAGQANGVVIEPDDIEVEEGYVNLLDPPAPPPPPRSNTPEARALATPPMSAKSSPRYGPALDKIAEEPEYGFPAKVKRTVEAVTIHPPMARSGRPRSYSNASDASTMSTSSRGPSVPDHTVVLSSTPPFALAPSSALPPPGLLSLGPPAGGSACSSRSNTPHTSPKLGPQPDPVLPSGRMSVSAHMPSGPSESLRSCTAAASAERPPRPSSPTLQQGVFDDLSDIWMNAASERGRRWSLASPRSLDAGSREGSLKSLHRVRSPPQEPQTEIFYFGMSDEEESDEAVDEEAGASDDVSGVSIHAGEGAFVLGGGSAFDAEDLGLVVDRQTSPAFPPLRCPTAVSPLIAQLNPLLSPVLAPCVNPGFLTQGCVADHLGMRAGTDRRLSTSSRGSGCSSPALGPASCKDQPDTGDSRDQRLLGEMGELMVKLQHSPELQIASQEIDVMELMERLEHFREVAGSAQIRRDM